MLRVYESVFGQNVVLFDTELEKDVVLPFSAAEEFANLVSADEVQFIPARVKNICDELNAPPDSWPVLMSAQMRHEVMELQSSRMSAALTGNEQYFSTWLEIRRFLDSLDSFEVDAPSFSQVLSKRKALTFRSDAKEVRPTYTTAGTATGRLTITAGPNFLVLPKEARKCVLRRFPDSTIYSIDFTSLEPRVCLWASDKSVDGLDVYESVMSMCNVAERDVAKLATLSALYGAGVNRLASMVENRAVAKDIMARVSDYFGIKQLNVRLNQAADGGVVSNMFGRPLFEATKNSRLRLNHYVQSTAAELALLLFSRLCASNPSVRPLLVIHDALIVEVPKSENDNFIEACNMIEYDGFSFPTKQEVLNN